jgi:hypothetical protein
MPKKMATTKKATIQLQNVNRPGQELPVDAVKYKATRKVLLKVVPKRTPGMTAAEIYGRALPLRVRFWRLKRPCVLVTN